jgi:hypothetical protein
MNICRRKPPRNVYMLSTKAQQYCRYAAAGYVQKLSDGDSRADKNCNRLHCNQPQLMQVLARENRVGRAPTTGISVGTSENRDAKEGHYVDENLACASPP